MAKWIVLAVLALPGLELLVFVAIASEIGFLRAALIVVLMSVCGIIILQRTGRNALSRLRSQPPDARIAVLQMEGGALFTALGALLLIIPGFITSVFAVPLLIAPLRAWLAKRLASLLGRRMQEGAQAGANRRGPADVIDLEPGEWRQDSTGAGRAEGSDRDPSAAARIEAPPPSGRNGR